MRKFKFLIIGAAMLLLTSCQNKAVDFNNDLVNIQKSVQPQVQEFAKKMQMTGDGTLTLKDLEADSKILVDLLDKKIAEINAVPTMEGGEELKSAILDQLKFERNICYKTGRLGNDQVTEEEKNAITNEFMNSEAEAKKLEDRVADAQRKFAEKHKFKLEKK